ncbi:hypothetical protein ACFL6E_01340 [Candidatus Neomarinimicrobiota bacterium]
MSREARVLISRLIIVAIYGFSILATVFNEFLITLSIASVGLMFWLIYLLSAGLGSRDQHDSPKAFAGAIARVVAGLGTILAVSAFITYSIEQTMWGGYTFNLLGLALGVLILVLTLAPLVLLHLVSDSSEIASVPQQTDHAIPGSLPTGPSMPPEASTPVYPYSYNEQDEEWEDEEDEEEDFEEDEEDYPEEDEEWDDEDEDEED